MSYILIIILFILFFSLQKRVAKLEHTTFPQQENTEPTRTAHTQEGAEEQNHHSSNPIMQDMMTSRVEPSTQPTQTNVFINWLKADWLVKIGAFLLLMAIGWFVQYAFANDWIGPAGRIMLGLVTGALFLAFGEWRMRKYPTQGSIFTVLGSTIILLVIFAARELYGLFTPFSALIVMSLSVVFVAYLSVIHKILPLALTSIILAGIAPLLSGSETASFIGLFSYLLIVSLGTLWVVRLTGWRILTTAAIILIALYSVPFFDNPPKEILASYIFPFIFAALFAASNISGILSNKEASREDLVTGGINGFLLLVWISTIFPEEIRSILTTFSAAAFSIGAFVVHRKTSRLEPFLLYSTIALVMLGVATAFELSGPALVIAYTLEAGAITLVAAQVLRNMSLAKKLTALLILPVLLSIESITTTAWRTGILHDHFFSLFILTATCFLLGLYFLRKDAANETGSSVTATSLLIVSGSLYSLILIWLVLHAAIESYDSATSLSLLIYTVIGLILYTVGHTRHMNTLATGGTYLLGLVVLRLLFVDVWDMEIVGRITTFFLIGLLLLGSAFLSKKEPSQIFTKD